MFMLKIYFSIPIYSSSSILYWRYYTFIDSNYSQIKQKLSHSDYLFYPLELSLFSHGFCISNNIKMSLFFYTSSIFYVKYCLRKETKLKKLQPLHILSKSQTRQRILINYFFVCVLLLKFGLLQETVRAYFSLYHQQLLLPVFRGPNIQYLVYFLS